MLGMSSGAVPFAPGAPAGQSGIGGGCAVSCGAACASAETDSSRTRDSVNTGFGATWAIDLPRDGFGFNCDDCAERIAGRLYREDGSEGKTKRGGYITRPFSRRLRSSRRIAVAKLHQLVTLERQHCV